MNYIKNDYGVMVIAEGAPASIARVKCEYPKLISELNSLYFQCYESHGRGVDKAIELIRSNGISSKLETNSLLIASEYGNEQPGSITSMVLSL